jgi:heme/copper-type cytochrome/quinol oxidase subunit 2
MKIFRSIFHAFRYVFFILTGWILGETAVFAQTKPGSEGSYSGNEGGGVWVWAYMIVILMLALGMMAVCLSSKRRDRAKPEVYSEAKPQEKK